MNEDSQEKLRMDIDQRGIIEIEQLETLYTEETLEMGNRLRSIRRTAVDTLEKIEEIVDENSIVAKKKLSSKKLSDMNLNEKVGKNDNGGVTGLKRNVSGLNSREQLRKICKSKDIKS